MKQINLLPAERACLLALKRIGSPATWRAIATEARMPAMKQNYFVENGLIKNMGRAKDSRDDCYWLTPKGLEACDGK